MRTDLPSELSISSAIRAVVFDAFGTLVEITDNRRPFHRLLELAGDGAVPRERYARAIMTAPYDLAKAAAAFCPSIRRDDLDALERDLEAEIASIRLFPDVAEVLVTLRERGIKISICSNLAIPYAEPVKRLLPIEMDALSWSFEVGAMKPDPAIYAHACGSLGCVEAEALMVGDKELEDFSGPMRAGMHALRLRRTFRHSDPPSLPTLKALAALSTAA